MISSEKFEIHNQYNKSFIINVINGDLGTNFLDMIDNDTKKIKVSQERKDYTKNLKALGQYVDPRSCVKCDKYLINSNNSISPMDDKDYVGIDGRFKAPSIIDITEFMKGVDSNMMYLFNLDLNINFNSDYEKNIFSNLKHTIMNKDLAYSGPGIIIGKIEKDTFVDIISYMELGFGYKEFNVKKEKFFNINTKKGSKYTTYINFEDMVDGDVEISLIVDKYIYLIFKYNGEIIYILSQRVSSKTNKATRANCSFINKKNIKMISGSETEYK
jgi:hypothetical protein